MALNLSSVSNVQTEVGAVSGLVAGALVLVSPQSTKGYQPQIAPSFQKSTAKLPPSLLFHYEGEQTATISSDVTDHFIENNTAIQDQVALKPLIITTSGFIGELNDVPPAPLAILQQAASALTSISAYAPTLSATALLAYNEAFQLYQTAANVAQTAISAYSTISGGGSGENVFNGSGQTTFLKTQTLQQQYFQQFYTYWADRTLFTIQTPWAIFQDMVIVSLRAVQDADTVQITDFEIQFKQLRFATTSSSYLYSDNSEFQGQLFYQGAPTTNLGTNSLTPSTTTFSSSIA